MLYRNTLRVKFPLDDVGNVTLNFKQKSFYDKKYWGLHLGADITAKAGTPIASIGNGIVVYSRLHPGMFSKKGKIVKRNWGGIVIIAHKNPKNKKIFYSLYGHLGKRFVKKGDLVKIGDAVGSVGKTMTIANGIWEDEHLHFAIYTGPFRGIVMPGYLRNNNTKLNYWKDPIKFIKNYSK